MRAATVEALTPLALASLANCFFHGSKPVAVLPHCAALALLAIDMSTTKAATVIVLEGASRCRLVADFVAEIAGENG
jgi:hypothetical protein